MTTLQSSLASLERPAINFSTSKISTHSFTIALTKGDVLVLATDEHDEHHTQRSAMYPVSLFYVDEVKPNQWKVIVAGRQHFLGTAAPIKIHPFLTLSLVTPSVQVKNHKGVCHLFRVNVTHGYKLHFLDFVKNKLPEIYSQLHIN